MTDEEIKQKVSLYFDFTDDKEYDIACEYIKKTGNSPENVKQGLVNYIDLQIDILKKFGDVDMKDFMLAHRIRNEDSIVQLVNLRRIISNQT